MSNSNYPMISLLIFSCLSTLIVPTFADGRIRSTWSPTSGMAIVTIFCYVLMHASMLQVYISGLLPSGLPGNSSGWAAADCEHSMSGVAVNG